MNPSELLTAMRRTVEQLGAFNDIAKALTSTLEVHEVLTLVMQKVSELLHPANWSLLLQDDAGQLYFEICVGDGSERLRQLRVPPGEGIVGACFQQGAPILVEDVSSEPRFSPRFDQATSFQTGSVLAVPLKSKGRVLGVIELVNPARQAPFSQVDLQTISGIADFAAIAIENARVFKKVQDLTISDEHTGLFNARHLRAVLEKEVARSGRFHHPLALIFLDLDGFKQVNDTHGHLVGSALLSEVGSLLADCIRQVDSAYRYGGDEFAVLLIETPLESAVTVAERIRDQLRDRLFMREQGLNLKLTASLGVACFPEHGQTAVELLQSSDQAMYRVKAQGRNDVLVAEPRQGSKPKPR